MCGIAGIGAHRAHKVVQQMLETLAHRGPDGQGIQEHPRYTLGHARLALLDKEGGAQPMSDSARDTHLVFNGEIYNHLTLRKAFPAHTFRSRSDTETLLHLVGSGRDRREWLRELDGMFAFAAVGPEGLMLARDPLGIKPLYIGRRYHAPVFASEIKAALRAGADPVLEFPPGHVYTSREGLQRYDTLEPSAPDVTNLAAASRGLLRRLTRSVRAGMTADAPVGVFLSGGVDSSLITALALRLQRGLNTFTVGMEGSSDLEYARQVASFLGTRHHERVFTLAEVLQALPEIIYHLESFDPALVRSAIPSYFAARLASKYVKAVLSGDGTDELFAGYDYLRRMEGDALHQELLRLTRGLHKTHLQRLDRMSMAHGLEARVPYLDHAEFVAYAFRIAPALKVRGPQQPGKWLLRQVAKSWLPPEIVWRERAGFGSGAGLGDQLARFAETLIYDAVFEKEREIADGMFLRSKEELLYYRLFREVFPVEKVLPVVAHRQILRESGSLLPSASPVKERAQEMFRPRQAQGR